MNSQAKQVISINWFWALSFVCVCMRRVLVCAPTLVNFLNWVVSTLCVNRFISGKSAVCMSSKTQTHTRIRVLCWLLSFRPHPLWESISYFAGAISIKENGRNNHYHSSYQPNSQCYLIFVLLNVRKRTSRRANNHRFENCAAFDMHFYWTFSRSECSKCTFYWWNVSVLQLRFR